MLRTSPVRILGERDREAVRALLDADPVGNVFVASRLMATGLVCLTAEAASAEALEIDISVLDPESFALDRPTGETRWVIESTGDFLLAEQHGAVPSMRFDLPPGQYRVTVWEMGSDAAAEQSVTIRNGETVRAALTLSPLNSALIARTRARTSRPAPDPTADAQTATAPSRPSQTERSEATGQQANGQTDRQSRPNHPETQGDSAPGHAAGRGRFRTGRVPRALGPQFLLLFPAHSPHWSSKDLRNPSRSFDLRI